MYKSYTVNLPKRLAYHSFFEARDVGITKGWDLSESGKQNP